jgi:hypothetical protein
MHSLKTKEDRLKEGLHILNQLREAGVSNNSGGFVAFEKLVFQNGLILVNHGMGV